ncbi:hypothetical protein HYPSUDRAFT_42684 [Hypholoma sublateritium FD-334 SS-4]|uniref:F-box domain-containing protein n=1 Tax=Hypholoma sublateritium (strain FD-334 SS-4) TaxID=945553 RepID=A0A0D2NQ18_HYPSF|nr:hypothetical protein HYPSUDRAFT_42684 [Hypholoma sublateritium FD-334 SS-4]
MQVPCLPQELVDSIIDDLFHDCRSLKNCALVARSWAQSCRRHIFNHITIDLALDEQEQIDVLPKTTGISCAQEISQNGARMEAVDLLLHAFSTASYLPSYIKHLTLKTYQNPLFDDINHSKVNDTLSEKLARALAQLTLLRSVDLDPRRWKEQPLALQRACLTCIGLPTVTGVSVQVWDLGVNDLLSLLSGLASTAALELRGSMYLQCSPEKALCIAYPPTAALRTLRMDGGGMIDFATTWLSNVPASCRRLESLDVNCSLRMSSGALQALLSVCPALTTLTITAPARTFLRRPIHILNLSLTPRLREVRLACIVLRKETDRVHWVRSIFGAATEPLSLRHLVLEFRYCVGAILEDLQSLDDFFSGPQFPCLQQVTILFSAQELGSDETEAAALLLRAQFPILMERNVIELICWHTQNMYDRRNNFQVVGKQYSGAQSSKTGSALLVRNV